MDDAERAGLLEKLSNVQPPQVSDLRAVIGFYFHKIFMFIQKIVT